MSVLENAPLIEAIFELRWGELSPGNFSYTDEESSMLPLHISIAASKHGFDFIETQSNPPFPFFVTHRFRKSENSWPCIQLGTGIFTVNQVNDNYNWEEFSIGFECGRGRRGRR